MQGKRVWPVYYQKNFILMLLARQTQLEALREQWIFTRQGKSIYR